MGGGLPWASQLNTTSLFFSRVSTGYTILPGCLVKTGLCRTLLSVGWSKQDSVSGQFVKHTISQQQKQANAALGVSKDKTTSRVNTSIWTAPWHKEEWFEVICVFSSYSGGNRTQSLIYVELRKMPSFTPVNLLLLFLYLFICPLMVGLCVHAEL